MNTCIIVADSTRARMFVCEALEQTWILIGEFQHPESRIKVTDLVDSDRGRTQQSFGGGNRPAMEPKTPPKQVEYVAFAQELAVQLNHNFDCDLFRNLILVAPPHFLGLLRKSLSAKLAKHIIATVDKDYTGLSIGDIQNALGAMLQSAG